MSRLAKKAASHLSQMVPGEDLETLKLELGLEKVLRLSMNENMYGPSPRVAEAICSWAAVEGQGSLYPDSRLSRLRKAVAEFHEVDPETLVFTNGLDEMIQLLARTFIEPGDEVLVHEPTFYEYGAQVKVDGGVVVGVPYKNYSIDWSGMKAALSEQTKLVYICNPNNPTGTQEPLSAIEDFLAVLPEDVLVLIDEAYFEYTGLPESQSGVALMARWPQVAVMRTFSKAYGLANIRCGYTIFPLEEARMVDAARRPFNVSSITETAALAAFEDREHLTSIVSGNLAERELWLDFLGKMALNHYPSMTSFVLFEVPDAARLIAFLRGHGFIVGEHSFPNWIRLNFPQAADGAKLRQLLEEFLAVVD